MFDELVSGPHNFTGKALLNYLISLGVIVEDSTPEYDPEMVAKVRRGRK